MKKFAFVLAAMWLVAACSPKEGLDIETSKTHRVFNATIEQGTRTFTSEGKVFWQDEDGINLFDQSNINTRYLYAGDEGATSGAFEYDTEYEMNPGDEFVEVGFENAYAIYPFQDYHEIFSDGTLYAYNSPGQYFAEDSFDQGTGLMVASTDDNNLEFKHSVGYLRIPLYGDDSATLYSVTVQSNNEELIAGDVLVTIAPGADPVIVPTDDYGFGATSATVYFYSDEYWDQVTLDPVETLDIWVALNPIAVPSGITVTVTNSDGGQFSYTSSNPLTIKRGVVTTTAPLEVVFPPYDPVVDYFYPSDYDEDVALMTAEEWSGEWHLYGRDYYGSGDRDFMGTINITESTTTPGGIYDDVPDEYVYVPGLFPFAVADGMGEGIYEMNVWGGMMYAYQSTTLDGGANVCSFGTKRIYVDGTLYTYFGAFVPVAEGIEVYMDVSQYYSSYNFNGLCTFDSQGNIHDLWYDMLLIRPDIDYHYLDLETSVAQAKKRFTDSCIEASHIPFANDKEFSKAASRLYMQKMAKEKSAPAINTDLKIKTR